MQKLASFHFLTLNSKWVWCCLGKRKQHKTQCQMFPPGQIASSILEVVFYLVWFVCFAFLSSVWFSLFVSSLIYVFQQIIIYFLQITTGVALFIPGLYTTNHSLTQHSPMLYMQVRHFSLLREAALDLGKKMIWSSCGYASGGNTLKQLYLFLDLYGYFPWWYMFQGGKDIKLYHT